MPCSARPARSQPSCTVRSNSHRGRPCSSRSIIAVMPPSCSTRCSSVSVMLSGATGQPGRLTIGMPEARGPAGAEVVAQAHGARRVVAHRRDPAVGGAGAERHHRGGPRGQPVDPRARRDRLARSARSTPNAAQWPSPLICSLGTEPSSTSTNGSSLPLAGVVPRLHEVLAGLVGEHRVVDDDAGHARDGARQQVLERRAGGRRHRDRVAVAAQAAGHPHDVDDEALAARLPGRELGVHRQPRREAMDGARPPARAWGAAGRRAPPGTRGGARRCRAGAIRRRGR